MTINELRKERGKVRAKISYWTRTGKDVTELRKLEKTIVAKINDYKDSTHTKKESKNQPVKVVKKGAKAPKKSVDETEKIQVIQKVKPNVTNKQKVVDSNIFHNEPIEGDWKKPELKKFQKEVSEILDQNDWRPGYEFRSSENMYIHDIEVKALVNNVAVRYLFVYKTKARKVVNPGIRYFTPGQAKDVQTWIDNMETWVMLNSGDLDDKQIVFGERFNKVQFEAKHMEDLGWVIKK